MTKVKICGITNLEDALLSAKFGADALGFNFYEKSPRYIAPEKASEIIEQLPEEILKVGVFVNEHLEKIVEIAETAKLGAVQLHGEEKPAFARELKQKTNLEIIKAFRVSPDFAPEDVLKYETDAILLDAYSPKEHGGTGETFDWEIAKKVQEIFPKMYLAGGLTHENINRAIYQTKPFAVDVCSGIEEKKGKKDDEKTVCFLANINFSIVSEQKGKTTKMNRISSSSNCQEWNSLRAKLLDRNKILPEWEKAVSIFEERILGRYFNTIEYIIGNPKRSEGEGFSILTLECAIIEYLATLQEGKVFKYETTANQKSYYYGNRKSPKLYNNFLNSADFFQGYFHGEGAFLKSHEFYQDVRCALIHETQTRKGWTVNLYKDNRRDDKLNEKLFEDKKIYRTALYRALKNFFLAFCDEARKQDLKGRKYRRYIARKLDVICEIDPDNCFWW